ncbi:HNH endonuclease, partial [Mycobacterium sp. M1]|nr:HNH endonuclease [Mycolicibacter acidiphilus]
MGRDAFADRETVLACLAAITDASARLAQCSFDALSTAELVEVLAQRDTLAWQAPVIDHRILARLAVEGHEGALGACSLVKGLAERLRISGSEARR